MATLPLGPERTILFHTTDPSDLGLTLLHKPTTLAMGISTGYVHITSIKSDGGMVTGDVRVNDVVVEAAGVNMRRPISEGMWKLTLGLMEVAPLPLEIVVAQEVEEQTEQEGRLTNQDTGVEEDKGFYQLETNQYNVVNDPVLSAKLYKLGSNILSPGVQVPDSPLSNSSPNESNNPFADPNRFGPERTITFRTESLGVKLHRSATEGIVHILHVTSYVPPENSSMPSPREGEITQGDAIMEVGGVDLRHQFIGSGEWADMVHFIRYVERPLEMIVAKDLLFSRERAGLPELVEEGKVKALEIVELDDDDEEEKKSDVEEEQKAEKQNEEQQVEEEEKNVDGEEVGQKSNAVDELKADKEEQQSESPKTEEQEKTDNETNAQDVNTAADDSKEKQPESKNEEVIFTTMLDNVCEVVTTAVCQSSKAAVPAPQDASESAEAAQVDDPAVNKGNANSEEAKAATGDANNECSNDEKATEVKISPEEKCLEPAEQSEAVASTVEANEKSPTTTKEAPEEVDQTTQDANESCTPEQTVTEADSTTKPSPSEEPSAQDPSPLDTLDKNVTQAVREYSQDLERNVTQAVHDLGQDCITPSLDNVCEDMTTGFCSSRGVPVKECPEQAVEEKSSSEDVHLCRDLNTSLDSVYETVTAGLCSPRGVTTAKDAEQVEEETCAKGANEKSAGAELTTTVLSTIKEQATDEADLTIETNEVDKATKDGNTECSIPAGEATEEVNSTVKSTSEQAQEDQATPSPPPNAKFSPSKVQRDNSWIKRPQESDSNTPKSSTRPSLTMFHRTHPSKNEASSPVVTDVESKPDGANSTVDETTLTKLVSNVHENLVENRELADSLQTSEMADSTSNDKAKDQEPPKVCESETKNPTSNESVFSSGGMSVSELKGLFSPARVLDALKGTEAVQSVEPPKSEVDAASSKEGAKGEVVDSNVTECEKGLDAGTNTDGAVLSTDAKNTASFMMEGFCLAFPTCGNVGDTADAEFSNDIANADVPSMMDFDKTIDFDADAFGAFPDENEKEDNKCEQSAVQSADVSKQDDCKASPDATDGLSPAQSGDNIKDSYAEELGPTPEKPFDETNDSSLHEVLVNDLVNEFTSPSQKSTLPSDSRDDTEHKKHRDVQPKKEELSSEEKENASPKSKSSPPRNNISTPAPTKSNFGNNLFMMDDDSPFCGNIKFSSTPKVPSSALFSQAFVVQRADAGKSKGPPVTNHIRWESTNSPLFVTKKSSSNIQKTPIEWSPNPPAERTPPEKLFPDPLKGTERAFDMSELDVSMGPSEDGSLSDDPSYNPNDTIVYADETDGQLDCCGFENFGADNVMFQGLVSNTKPETQRSTKEKSNKVASPKRKNILSRLRKGSKKNKEIKERVEYGTLDDNKDSMKGIKNARTQLRKQNLYGKSVEAASQYASMSDLVEI